MDLKESEVAVMTWIKLVQEEVDVGCTEVTGDFIGIELAKISTRSQEM